MMRIEVLLDYTDLKKYTASAIRFWSKKKKRKFNRVDAILYTGLFFILLFYVLGSCMQIKWFDFLAGVLVGFIIILMIVNEQKKILEPKVNGFVFGPTVYEFTEEGIKIKKKSSESFTEWSAVESVFNAKDYYYIFVDHNLAYVIPKRVFLSSELSSEFASLLNRLMPGKIFNQ
jgi:hypothetical protein